MAGYAIRHSILGMRLAGRHLTEYYTKHLTAENDFPFEKNNKMSVIEKLKDKSTLVAKDYDRYVAACVSWFLAPRTYSTDMLHTQNCP